MLEFEKKGEGMKAKFDHIWQFDNYFRWSESHNANGPTTHDSDIHQTYMADLFQTSF